MKKIRTITVAYLGSGYQRYVTFYQDLLDSYYFASCGIEIGTERCVSRYSIKNCTKEYIINCDYYPDCKTHYVDPAGNLIGAAK
jgi:hypothetical protein